jgi:hypothetical protein
MKMDEDGEDEKCLNIMYIDYETIKRALTAKDFSSRKLQALVTNSSETPMDSLALFEGNKERMLRFYDGVDVTLPTELEQWQRDILRKIAGTQADLREDKKMDTLTLRNRARNSMIPRRRRYKMLFKTVCMPPWTWRIRQKQQTRMLVSVAGLRIRGGI